jgi:hypothetical protein
MRTILLLTISNHLHDYCMVWPPEIPQRGALESDRG